VAVLLAVVDDICRKEYSIGHDIWQQVLNLNLFKLTLFVLPYFFVELAVAFAGAAAFAAAWAAALFASSACFWSSGYFDFKKPTMSPIKGKDSKIFWQDPFNANDAIHRHDSLSKVWSDLCKVPCKETLPKMHFTFREFEATERMLAQKIPLNLRQGLCADYIKNRKWNSKTH